MLAELRRHLPHESFAYVADQRFAPYGDRTLDEVRERSVHITGALIDAGAKAVVVACNSASAAALHHLRAVRPGFPFIGMEPAVKPAALESRSGVIGVLATSATFQGELFASVVDKHAGDVEVITVAEPVLFHLVEDGPDAARGGGDVLDAVISHLLARRVDTIVLGCTHYAFLKDAIRRLCGPGVAIVDPAPSVARQVGRASLNRRAQRLLGPDPAAFGITRRRTRRGSPRVYWPVAGKAGFDRADAVADHVVSPPC